MVETVLFDLDNTLLDFNQAEKNAVSKTLAHFHITPEASILKRYSELNLAQWKLLEQGKGTWHRHSCQRSRVLI